MYTHKGAQLRLHGQHFSFSLFFIVLGFIATFMVLYPFIYNFIGCFKKKNTERERKESLEENLLYGMAVMLKYKAGTSWSTAEAVATWVAGAMVQSACGAGLREAGLGCMQPSQGILQHRNAGHCVSWLCLSGLSLVAFCCFPLQMLFSHVLPPTAPIFLQMQPLNSSSPSSPF